MSDGFVALAQTWLSWTWSLFALEIPGLGLSVGALSIGVALMSISLLVAKQFFGLGGHGGESPRTGSTRNPKISDRRKGDEF